MQELIVKEIREQEITVNKVSGCVESCFRKVVLTDLGGNEDYDVTLTGGDALNPLKKGQLVLADLRCDYLRIFGEEKKEYWVAFICPIEMGTQIKFIEDRTTHLV